MAVIRKATETDRDIVALCIAEGFVCRYIGRKISVFCINRWIRYIAIVVAIIAIIYAIVSSVAIEKSKK